MNEYISEQRDGSFLHPRIPVRAYKRSAEKRRIMIEWQIRECLILLCYDKKIQREMSLLEERSYWADRAESYELLVVRLLNRMKLRGIVKWHLWNKVCGDSYYVDVKLGIDHFGELTDEFGGIFFTIDTKSSQEALERHWRKRNRELILGFCPAYAPDSASDEEMRKEEDRLLKELLLFFGSGNVREI